MAGDDLEASIALDAAFDDSDETRAHSAAMDDLAACIRGDKGAHDMRAGLSECRQLYDLSGWREKNADESSESSIPSYSLNTLHSLLPAHTLGKFGNATWQARWVGHVPWQSEAPAPPAYRVTVTAESRTNPANALARLAIKLFEAGVLLR